MRSSTLQPSETEYAIQLHKILCDEVATLSPSPPVLASEHSARKRLDDLSNAAPPVLVLLAGKLLVNKYAFETFADCARIHLYARILDDALDENLPVHRKHLLLAQPMFWAATGRLSIRHKENWNDATKLIEETVQGVLTDDNQISPESWGAKNHHLLLIPLFLTCNDKQYQTCRNALSQSIWLLQAADELRQGRLQQVTPLFLDALCGFMNGSDISNLAENGWRKLVERCLLEGRQLLNVLEKSQKDAALCR